MRTIIFARFTLLMLWCAAAAANADEVVPAFEKLVRASSESMASAKPVYLNKHLNKWAKRRFALAEVKYDVKKTDSLLNPIIGLVNFTLTTQQTELFETKEQADQAGNFSPKASTFKVSLTYAFKDDRWTFISGEYEDSNPPPYLKLPKFSLTEAKILAESDAIPMAALRFWLPSAMSK